MVGATGIEPVTPAMSTQLPPLKPAQIHAISISYFPFRSVLVHGNLGPTWGVSRVCPGFGCCRGFSSGAGCREFKSPHSDHLVTRLVTRLDQ
jgi:hypothetical protein